MAASPDDNQPLIISYLTLRKAVGILGIVLPWLLIVGFDLFDKQCRNFPPSISHFYYTDMGNWFVGTLCAVSLFMFCYNGHGSSDMRAAKLAGLFALMVAMFPTDFNAFDDIICSRISLQENRVANIIHYVSASLLFCTFAYFALFEFTKTNKRGRMGWYKRTRNSIYRICGWVIIICIAGIAVIGFVDDLSEKFKRFKPTFVLETIALMAFGLSWLIKGETFFKDKKIAGKTDPDSSE